MCGTSTAQGTSAAFLTTRNIHMAIRLSLHFTVISDFWNEISNLTIISRCGTIILK